jgi:hypothetical protein
MGGGDTLGCHTSRINTVAYILSTKQALYHLLCEQKTDPLLGSGAYGIHDPC